MLKPRLAFGIEDARALDVRGNVIAGVGVVGRHPLDALHRLLVAGVAAVVGELAAPLVELRVQRAAGHGAIPVVVGAPAQVGVGAVEAVLPLCNGIGVAAAARGQLAGGDGHVAVLVAGDDRLLAHEQRLLPELAHALHHRVHELLDDLPAVHAAVEGVRVAPDQVTLDRSGADAGAPGRTGPLAFDIGVARGRARLCVIDQRAVAVAAAAVAGHHEPVQAVGVDRLVDQPLHRNLAVGAGGVVVEVTGGVAALVDGLGLCRLWRTGQRDEGAGGSGRKADVAHDEAFAHDWNSWL
jgi:hypothetical protein